MLVSIDDLNDSKATPITGEHRIVMFCLRKRLTDKGGEKNPVVINLTNNSTGVSKRVNLFVAGDNTIMVRKDDGGEEYFNLNLDIIPSHSEEVMYEIVFM